MPCGELAEPRPRRPVVEEEARVEVVRQVDLEQQPALVHRRRPRRVRATRAYCAEPRCRSRVLRKTSSAATPRTSGTIASTSSRRCSALPESMPGGRRVLGDVYPALARVGSRAFVHVDRDRVVGQVGVVDAVAGHAAPARPLLDSGCAILRSRLANASADPARALPPSAVRQCSRLAAVVRRLRAPTSNTLTSDLIGPL